MNLDSKTILITGAAGFVGSALLKYFSQNYPNAHIIALDCFKKFDDCKNQIAFGDFKNIIFGKNIQIASIDINDFSALKRLFNKNDIFAIFHSAALSDTTYDNEKIIMHTNYNSFKELAYLALYHKSHLIYASSGAVYGNHEGVNSVGFNENPLNIYGFSKLCADNELMRIKYDFIKRNLAIIALRYFNVYGHSEFHKGSMSSMILQLALQAYHKKEVNLFEFGEQRRDFIYIKDVIKANEIALKHALLLNPAKNLKPDSQNDDFSNVIDQFDSIDLSTKKIASNATKILKRKLKKINDDENIDISESKNISGIYNVGTGKSVSYNEIVKILESHFGFSIKINYIKNPYSFFQNNTQANAGDFLPDFLPDFDIENGIKDYMNDILKICKDNVKI